MKKYQLYLLSVLSGLLLGFSWFPPGFLPLIFIAFVPLLLVEETICNESRFKPGTLFFCGLTAFLIWNLITTWWLKNASAGGAVMAIGLNSLIMATFFLIAHKVKKRIGKWGSFLFICFWIGFEFIHLNWELSWSWLTLGNIFADAPGMIQWYEYTGTLGGSLWVLLVNILFYLFLVNYRSYSVAVRAKKTGIIVAVIILPLLTSFLIAKNLDASSKKELNVVILQPNVDPYNEKFFFGFEEQLKKMIALCEGKVDSTTDYLVFPETALTEDIWEEAFDQSQSIKMLNSFLAKYPKLKIIIGANTFKAFKPGEKPSETARKFTQEDGYYDVYNTALQVDNSRKVQVYHKSLLVPGVESMPLQFIFKHFESLAMDMGGTVGSLGIQKERSLLVSGDGTAKIAPVICYESIFGEYVTDYVKKGANLIAIITNDGWWGNTPGYIQHLKYGRLRAIENRRWVARSANTGVSCFISPAGEIIQPAGYWVPATISGKVGLNEELTFYSRHGDYIGRIAFYTALILLIYSWLLRFGIVKKS